MRHHISVRWLIAFFAALTLLLTGCGSQIPHPPEATALPDQSAEITDIRIRAVPCEDYQLDLGHYTGFEGKTLLQIQYGYLSDGQWHDIPSENYELKGIFDSEGVSGFSAASKDHLVRIGPYLLICHILHTSAPNSECIIEDPLGTQAQEPLKAFSDGADNEGNYALLVTDRESILAGEKLRFTAYGAFGHYYYLIIPMENLTEDYTLRITDHTWSDSYDNEKEYVLTMDTISDLLDME